MVCTTKKEAQDKGEVKYFTGKTCKNGHTDFRYTNTGICYGCKREQNNRDYRENTGRVSSINKKSYLKNRAARLATSQRWAEKNREKSNSIKKAYKLRNLEKVRLRARKYQKEKRKDPLYRLNKNISKAIWQWLKVDKNYEHWEDFVDFTRQELRNMLESKFEPGMTWDNYGTAWHVDHSKPQSLCESFEECWSLGNLQPMWAKHNLSKGNRYEGKYKPGG